MTRHHRRGPVRQPAGGGRDHPLNDLETLLGEVARRRLGAEGVAGLRRVTAGATQEGWQFSAVKGGGEAKLILPRAPGRTRASGAALGLQTGAPLLDAPARARGPRP